MVTSRKIFLANKRAAKTLGLVNRVLGALLASFVVASTLGESPEPTKVRITTWNLQWFPSGSANEASLERQNQRIKEAADVLRPINPDIILLQEVGITKHAFAWAKPSHHGPITSQFAPRSRNHSKADSVNSRWRFYSNIKRKPHGQNLGNP